MEGVDTATVGMTAIPEASALTASGFNRVCVFIHCPFNIGPACRRTVVLATQVARCICTISFDYFSPKAVPRFPSLRGSSPDRGARPRVLLDDPEAAYPRKCSFVSDNSIKKGEILIAPGESRGRSPHLLLRLYSARPGPLGGGNCQLATDGHK
jgi:hypothetical protein